MADEMSKRIEAVSVKILSLARSELYLHMRFMDVALSTLRYVCDGSISTIGTDGIFLYYHPGYLGGLYRESRARVNRVYLHMILHCIFAHPWKKVRLMKKKQHMNWE